MNRINKSSGFTLVELLLAMTFISVLLLVIAATVIQLSHIYNKGMTMKAVDQAGRALSEDIRRTLSQSQPFDTDTSFVRQVEQGIEYGGRLCTGQYTYVWNYGATLADETLEVRNQYEGGGDDIRFVRVRDNGGQYCNDGVKNILQSDATELLGGDDPGLAIQSFGIKRLDKGGSAIDQAMYRIVMEIGTNTQDALQQAPALDTIITSCKPPSEAAVLENFCAVNQFYFTAQAGNKGGLQ